MMLNWKLKRRSRKSLVREERGIAATEFALVLPFMIILLLGSVDAVFALTAKRKVALATHSIADLTARLENETTEPELTTIAELGRLIMTPFNVANSEVVISGVRVTAARDRAVVEWSRKLDAMPSGSGAGSAGSTANTNSQSSGAGGVLTALPPNQEVPLNASLAEGTFLVVASVNLPYNTLFRFLERHVSPTFSAFQLQDTAFFQSRNGLPIDLN